MTTPDFIKKHPTPWKITTVTPNPKYTNLDVHEEIQDANSNTIIAACDAEGYRAWFEGDAEELITFINNHFGGH